MFYICLIVYLYGDLAIYAAAVPVSLMEVSWWVSSSPVWPVLDVYWLNANFLIIKTANAFHIKNQTNIRQFVFLIYRLTSTLTPCRIFWQVWSLASRSLMCLVWSCIVCFVKNQFAEAKSVFVSHSGNHSCSAGSVKYNDTESCWGPLRRKDAYRVFLVSPAAHGARSNKRTLLAALISQRGAGRTPQDSSKGQARERQMRCVISPNPQRFRRCFKCPWNSGRGTAKDASVVFFSAFAFQHWWMCWFISLCSSLLHLHK